MRTAWKITRAISHDHHAAQTKQAQVHALPSAGRRLAARARSRAFQQQIALANVSREGRGALELLGRLRETSEFAEKVAPHAR